jgi:hypothetical protein
MLFGLALVMRPHVLLLSPAVVLVVAMSATGNAEAAHGELTVRRRARARALLAWGLAASLGLAFGFAPVAAQGMLGNFVQGVRQANYGSYGEYPVSFAGKLITQFAAKRITVGYALAAAAVVAAPSSTRRLALPWLLMLVLVLVYRPLHPVPHAYLAHPLWLIWSLNLAVIAGVVMQMGQRRPWMALGSVGLLLALASPRVPKYWDLGASLRAIGDLTRRTEPALVPPGAAPHFAPASTTSPYTWEQYCEVLDYLRQRTGPNTQIANLLRNLPFPGLNGTIGRISPLRADSGVLWLYALGTDREADFARDLEAAGDAVVIWIPGEQTFDRRLEIPIIERTVPRFYCPEANLSGVQVWRRMAQSR